MTPTRVADKPVETLVGGYGEKADGARGDVRPIVTVIHPPTGSRPPCICLVRPPTMELRPRLQHVLAGQSFPADRWELIAAAEMYGADLVTRSELQALLPVRFPCLADVLLAVERTRRVTPATEHLVPDAGPHDLCACAGTSPRSASSTPIP
jgi:hypothetical protein